MPNEKDIDAALRMVGQIERAASALLRVRWRPDLPNHADSARAQETKNGFPDPRRIVEIVAPDALKGQEIAAEKGKALMAEINLIMGLPATLRTARPAQRTIKPAEPNTAGETLSAKRPAMGAPIPTASGHGVIIKPVSTWLR
jgi:hypothetical protein